MLDDGALVRQDWGRFATVLAPKVDGARHLDELTLGLALDHFVLYSSVASLLGSPGQANHAAANAYLDALPPTGVRAASPASASTGARGPRSAPPVTHGVESRVSSQGLGVDHARPGARGARAR